MAEDGKAEFKFLTGQVQMNHSLVTDKVTISALAGYDMITAYVVGTVEKSAQKIAIVYDESGQVLSTWQYSEIPPPECPAILRQKMAEWRRTVNRHLATSKPS